MANATLRERQTQYKSCPQELYKLNAQQLIYCVIGVQNAFRNYLLKTDDTTVIIVTPAIKPKAKLTSDWVACPYTSNFSYFIIFLVV
jgi:hypothetical protein